jgi:hypothetical protein
MSARSALVLGLVLLGTGLVAPARAERRPAAPPSPGRTSAPARLDFASFDALPLDFEENRGQCDPAARFLARGRGFLAFLTDEGAVFACAAGPGPDRHAPLGTPLPAFDPDVVRMRFPGSAAGAPRAGGVRRPGVSNYLVGRDVSRRAVGVRRWGEVLRPGLWPGIDLHWRGGARRSLEYRFHVAAGADPSRIALAFEGAVPRHGPDGELHLATPRGVLRHGRPSAWQETERGRRAPVDVAYALRPDGSAGFSLGVFDRSRPLVVDPQVAFAHTRGGNGEDEAWGITSDTEGYVYFCGWAASTNMPLQSPYQATHGGGTYDAFVVKLGVRGTGTVYATYLGGTGSDLAYGIAVGADGAAHVVGGTLSSDFPTVGAFQPETGTGNETGFVARLAPGGGSLTWSTYLGGTVRDAVRQVVFGAGGDLYLGGGTSSPDFPVAGAAQPATGGAVDGFVARMGTGDGSLAWSTFLGGEEIDEVRALGTGSDGTVFVAGMTESVYFPDKNALQATLSGPRDGFAAALASDGSEVAWATYVGGSGTEEGWGLTVDATGHPWVVGYTTSPDFPLQAPLDSVYEGQFEAFAVKFAADGSERILSTFLGGNQEDKAEAATSDGAGVVYVVGRTASPNFPVLKAVDKFYGGGDFDAFVTAISPSTTQIFWSTFYGGPGTDYAMAAAVDPFGALLFAGRNGGSADGLAASIIAVPLPPPSISATLVGLNRIRVNWTDQGDTETGYVVESRVAGGDWGQAAVLGANAFQWYDVNLLWATTYEYRIYSVNEFGESARSMVASATTRPMPTAVPAAPSNLQVTSVNAARVNLSWTLHSDDEDTVVVDRYKEFFGFLPERYLDMDATSWSDTDVLPMRTYRYRVRASNFLGSSAPSNEVEAVVPGSFDATVVSGKRRNRDGERKDSITLSGVATRRNNVTAWRKLDPRTVLVEMHLGDDPTPLFSIPANYAGWKEKRGSWVLKYPYYPRGKLRLTFSPDGNSWTVVLKKADLPEISGSPERARLFFGDDGTEFYLPWVPGRREGDATILED